ncbi:unnamed protein product [Caenorhabditis angaria]|uniref:T20D4.11-like domain-containing protein n=1 Tax=Caenorhabditis angaria TaxID=860376 RepID=A0A9P1ITD8_9PELO|nr:unnamed protein product [Caenorhabditis angaria]
MLIRVLTRLTCCFLWITVFITAIIGIIYLCLFVLVSNDLICKSEERTRLEICKPKITVLTTEILQLNETSAKYDDLHEICKDVLACLHPIKCKSQTNEFEYVRNFCQVISTLAFESGKCFKSLNSTNVSCPKILFLAGGRYSRSKQHCNNLAGGEKLHF